MRIRRRRFLLGIAGIGLLVASLLLFITSSPFQQWLLRRAEIWAANAGVPFTASRLRLDLTELTASVEGLAYAQNGQRIQVKQLHLDLPWGVLRGEDLRITSLEADGVTVDIRPPETSTASTTTAAPPPRPSPRIQIDHLVVRNLSLSYSTPTLAVKVPSVSLEATNHRGVIRFDAPVSIGADTTVTLKEIPVVLDNESAQFGPASWHIRYTTYAGSGSARGLVRWSPRLAVEADATTDPTTLQQWKDIQLRGKIAYADGTLNIPEFHVGQGGQGGGEAEGAARVSGAGTSATVTWRNIRLDPTGLKANTNGNLNLKWEQSDFSDLSADGQTTINSPDYGRLQTNIKVTDAKAQFDVRASARDLAFRGQVHTELQPILKGDFRDLRATVRGTVQPPATGPLYERVGPVSISASARLRDKVLSVRSIRAAARGSHVSDATFEMNTANRTIRGKVPEVVVNVPDLMPDAGGTLRLSADIGGSVSQPTASFMASSSGLTFRNVTADNVQLSGSLTPDSSGVSELRGTLSGTLHPLAALPTSGSLYEGFRSVDFSAAATFRENVISVQDIRAQSKASRLSDGTFQMNLGDKQLSGQIPDLRVDLSDITPDTTGTVILAAQIGGTAEKPTAAFSGSSSGLDIFGAHIDMVGLEGNFAENAVVLTRLEARQSDGILNATGSANLTTEAIAVDAKVTNVKLVQIEDLSATAFLDAHVGGTYRTPSVSFNGELRDVIYQQQEHGNVRFEGMTDLKTGTVLAKSPKYSASANATVALEAPYAFSAGLTATDSHIAHGMFNAVANGRVRMSGEAQPFKASQIEFDAFRVRAEGIELVANGPVSPGAQIDMKVDLAQLPVEGIELGGNAQILATVSGNLENPRIEGALKTSGATVRTMQMSAPVEVSALVDFAGNEISIRDLTANYAGATASITGKGAWDGSGQLEFRVDNLRPENLAPGRSVSGLATAEGKIDIRSPRLEDISGTLTVTGLDLTVRDAMIRQTQPIQAELRNQMLTVQQFEIEGLDTHVRLTGHADLRDSSLHFDADADTDLAILEPFIPNSHPAGRIETRVALRGTADKPELDGFINISDGELAIETPRVGLSEVNVEAQVRGDRIELTRATGLINGGMFKASGGTGVSAAGLNDTALQVSVERAQLQFPEGLQSEITSELKLSGTMPNLTLSGTVDVLSAVYRKNFNLTQELFAQITAPPQSIAAAPGIGDQIRMEVEVRTPGAVVVKNNVADLEATGTFRVRGTAANPILLGRALVAEGGELYFGPAVNAQSVATGQRSDRYTIERGSIDFNNPLRTEPELDFRATHELEVLDERYLITLEASGTPQTLKAELTSDPYMDQDDIVSMLLTGRTLHELQGTYAAFAGEQALGYVSGQLSDRVLSQAGAALGLNTVRVDPVMIANQTDVAARLTIGKDITPEFSLIYSQYLNSAEAQTWIASYKPFRNLVLRGINDAEQQELLVDLKHDVRFGSGSEWLKRTRPQNETKLRTVTFAGSQFTEKDLRKQVTSEGDPWGPYRMSEDVRNLRLYLASKGYPSARIKTQENPQERNVDVNFEISEGPKMVFAYEGADVPDRLQKEIQEIWTLRSSPTSSLRDSTTRILRHFRNEGYLQAQVSTDDSSSTSTERRYVFKIVPGDKFDTPAWMFHGVEPIAIPDPAGVVMESPKAIKERVESHFRTNSYLDVEASTPSLVIDGDKAHFEITVVPKGAYAIDKVEFDGNRALDAERLRGIVAQLSKDSEETIVRFTEAWLMSARQRIASEYWKDGYNDVQIVPSTTRDSTLAQIGVRFSITEGERQVVETIEITGVKLTNPGFIQRQFQFKEGDPVDDTKVNLTRKKLYDTGVFRRVEIEMVPGVKGYIARVHLTETDPWQLRYGISVTEHLDTGDKAVGVSTDLSYHNFLGKGITLGIAGKLNSDERDGRMFGSSPLFFGRKVTTSLTLFRTRDLTDPEDVVDYWGTTIQQQWRIGQRYLLSYDYSYRKVLRGERTSDLIVDDGDTILDNPRVPIARFGVSLSRDTRDDILNATRGTFISNSFEIAPPNIGSSVEFYRNFSQALYFQPVKKFVLASAIRFGLIKPINDDELDKTLQYSAGGSTTVRAFKQDGLTREPGNYELILNQEFRFPLFWKFSGVAFMDVGQVALKSKNLFDFRYAPGVGIRIMTPFVMVRTDLGINVWARPGEDRGRWSFGIGQAF